MSPPPFSPELCSVSAAKLASPKPKHPLRFRAAAPASAWSESDRRWAEENGLFRGDGAGNFAYRSFCTREELAAVARRLAEQAKRD